MELNLVDTVLILGGTFLIIRGFEKSLNKKIDSMKSEIKEHTDMRLNRTIELLKAREEEYIEVLTHPNVEKRPLDPEI